MGNDIYFSEKYRVENQPALHASAVVVRDVGIVIIGRSGAGKSTLANKLIEQGGILIADDYCIISDDEEGVHINSPQKMSGYIHLRDQGLIQKPHIERVKVQLILNLAIESTIPFVKEDMNYFHFKYSKFPLYELNPHDPVIMQVIDEILTDLDG